MTGPTEGLEPQVLDFRYQPARWQTCIGLVDDPYKTIVGDDGGLYYEYGKQGPEAYNNGQGSFGTRILAGFVADADAGTLRQSLYSPRVPIVISEREVGSWRLRQETWSNRMRDTESAQPSADRVDYLAIAATNGGAESAAGQVTLDIGTTTHLVLDDARERLLIDGRSDRIFCQFSQACEPLAQEPQIGVDQKARIRTDASVRVQRDWAQPSVDCAACFRHVLVGFGQPLGFQVPVASGGQLQVALGLIEGWHAEPGKRPLRIEVEGTPVRELDLVREYGQNVPVVLTFAAKDSDQDGMLLVKVHPVAHAEDGNTILSGLWVFPADSPRAAKDILTGRLDGDAIARVDADSLPSMPRPMRLTWRTGKVAAGESFTLFVAVPQGEDGAAS